MSEKPGIIRRKTVIAFRIDDRETCGTYAVPSDIGRILQGLAQLCIDNLWAQQNRQGKQKFIFDSSSHVVRSLRNQC